MDQIGQSGTVLFVIFQLGIGGVEGQMRNLANHLSKRGLPISVYVLCKKSLDIDILKMPDVTVHFGNRRHAYDPFPVFQIKKYIQQVKPSLLVCFDRHSWLYCLIARKLSNAHMPIIARSMETRGLITWRAEVQLWFARILSLPHDRMVALSTSLKSQLVKRWRFSEEKIKLIPIGIDTEKFSPKVIHQFAGKREELGIPGKSNVIVQIGNLSTNKNHEFSLELVRDLVQKEKMDVFLVVVGGGSKQRWEELHNLMHHFGIAERIIFTGVQEDVRPYLSMADLLLLCSKAEATPNVVLESLSGGVPVLVSEYDSAEEQLGADLREWTISLINRKEFVIKAVKLLQNPDLRQEIGAKGCKRVQDQFSIERLYQRWEGLIREILDKQEV